MGFQPDGRELVIVAVKGTYELADANGSEPALMETQVPLQEADEFGEDPAYDAPIRENDFAPHKPLCDVLVTGQAYAPDGKPAIEVPVGFRVGSCQKSFIVTGSGCWLYSRMTGVVASKKVPFVTQSISYDSAFGGTDIHPEDPNKVQTYVDNPVGTGFCKFKQNLDRMPMPTSYEAGNPIKSPTGKYKPMAFGPLGRNFASRYPLAGTYDQQWLDNRAPFLPTDFDFRYFQAAPADQQIPHPKGGEQIFLMNMTPSGRTMTQVPRQDVQVMFLRKRGRSETVKAKLDTILLEPKDGRMTMTWRAPVAANRDCFELREAVVSASGGSPLARAKADRKGKTHYSSLGEAARSNGGRRR